MLKFLGIFCKFVDIHKIRSGGSIHVLCELWSVQDTVWDVFL